MVSEKVIRDFCDAHGIRFLGIFGSRAERRAKKGSDLDLLVELREKRGLLGFVRLERELSKIFKKRVDLVSKRGLSPYLKPAILRQVKVLYEGG